MGGGGFSMEPENPRLDAFVLSLARSSPPRVCFIPTASGDSEGYVANFYRAFAAFDCTPSDLTLFDRGVDDLEAFVLAQDVVYVGGGNTASLLAVWRAHGLDAILRRAWARGHRPVRHQRGDELLVRGVGDRLVRHAARAAARRPRACWRAAAARTTTARSSAGRCIRRLVASGELRAGWAADDGAALVFAGTELAEVVSSRPDAGAYRVEQGSERARCRPLSRLAGVHPRQRLGDAHRLVAALALERELQRHLRAAGHVLEVGELGRHPHLAPDR